MKNKKIYIVAKTLIIIATICLLNFLLLHFESQSPDASIKTFGDTIWWSLITLSTIGYGDMFPVTLGGKIIGGVYIFGSLGILGFLVSSMLSKINTIIERKKLGMYGTKFKDHIVIIGWNDFSKGCADNIIAANQQVCIVTDKKDSVDLIYQQYGTDNVFVLFTDYEDISAYSKANIENAASVFVNFTDDTQTLLFIINLKDKYSVNHVIVSLKNSKLKQTMMSAGVKYVVSRAEIASNLVSSFIFEKSVAEISADILGTSKVDTDLDMAEFKILDSNKYVNGDYHEVFAKIKDKYNAILLGIYKNGTIYKNPDPSKYNIYVEAGDYLTILCNGYSKTEIEKEFDVREGDRKSVV